MPMTATRPRRVRDVMSTQLRRALVQPLGLSVPRAPGRCQVDVRVAPEGDPRFGILNPPVPKFTQLVVRRVRVGHRRDGARGDQRHGLEALHRTEGKLQAQSVTWFALLRGRCSYG